MLYEVITVVLTLVAISVISILLTAVVPQVVAQFVHLSQTLPFSTRLLIGASELVRDFGLWVLLLLALAGLAFRGWNRQPERRRRFHGLLLRLPITGRVSRGLNTARFARTLSILTVV